MVNAPTEPNGERPEPPPAPPQQNLTAAVNRDSATLRKVYGILKDGTRTPRRAQLKAREVILEAWGESYEAAYPEPVAGGDS